MLTHPTHGRLVTLGLTGMAKALDEQQRQPDIATLAFEERLALLVDREATERDNKRLISRLRFASLRQNAVVEDIDMKAPRGLDKALFQKLIAGEWIERHRGNSRNNRAPIKATLPPLPPPQRLRPRPPRGPIPTPIHARTRPRTLGRWPRRRILSAPAPRRH